jgi:hypothetical protein
MKKYLSRTSIVLVLIFAFSQLAEAQQLLLKKIKEKAEEEAVEKLFGSDKNKEEKTTGEQGAGSESATYGETGESSGISNTRGGLTTTPPDVAKNIDAATTAYKDGKYSEARNATRQAVLGVEIEMGKNVLKELPETVKGLNKVPEEDRVSSMSIGFVGLTIERVYRSNNQELKLMISNDASLYSSVNMYMGAGGYAASTDQEYKQVELKGNRGILEYDESSGYDLRVPFGQSSVLMINGINFASEDEIMAAAGEFDIDKIKKELGEQ